MSHYPVENLLREATEGYAAAAFFSLALLAQCAPHLLLLSTGSGHIAAGFLAAAGSFRAFQALRVKRYQKRLMKQPYYALSTIQIPTSQKWLFVGKGFRWMPLHTQRLHQLKQISNQKYIRLGPCQQFIRDFCRNNSHLLVARLLERRSPLNPFRPLPDVGGKPWLHGVGDRDRSVFIPQSVRPGHTFVVGTTRVGKTRLASVLINQDIRNGDAVIVVDPKGDLELLRDMYSACRASGRLQDFRIVHLGFPGLSAQYNPLKNYDQISEVATRITDAIAAEGEGAQFKAFAWKYTNIVAICLEEMGVSISYKSIAFYINRLDQLLMAYADSIMPSRLPHYEKEVASILDENDSRVDKHGKAAPPMERAKAVALFMGKYISETIADGKVSSLHDQILIDLYDAAVMDKTYYAKHP